MTVLDPSANTTNAAMEVDEEPLTEYLKRQIKLSVELFKEKHS